MTPEQQREQWLKRILPALGVLVVYFVIVSGFVTEKSKKAEAQFMGLEQKGVNAAALQGLEQQQGTLREEIAQLDQENKSLHSALVANSSFLSNIGSPNDTIQWISGILAKNKLLVQDLKHNDKPDVETFPKSLRDTYHWLKDISSVGTTAGAKTKDLNIWMIRYTGTYLDNYRALSALAASDTSALPVSLTMQAYKSNTESNTGKQEWVLTLWL